MSPYEHGVRLAFAKLGMVLPTLTSAGLGAVSGYYLSPEDRKGLGTGLGALLAGAGTYAGGRFLRAFGNNPDAEARLQRLGLALGGLGGLGTSQAFVNKNTPDQSEDPYLYSHGAR